MTSYTNVMRYFTKLPVLPIYIWLFPFIISISLQFILAAVRHIFVQGAVLIPKKLTQGFSLRVGVSFTINLIVAFLMIKIFNASPSFPFVTEHPHIVCINLLHCVLWEYVNVRNMYMIQAFRYIYVFGVTVYMFIFQPRVWNVVGSCLLLMWPTLKTQFYSTSKVIIHEQISKHCHDLREQT